ncbi:MAG: hypothetical protein LBH20_07920 [Treponema sp.]|nr:hypothetical protein [Treponema sp.]
MADEAITPPHQVAIPGFSPQAKVRLQDIINIAFFAYIVNTKNKQIIK